MRNFITLLRRELGSYFLSPIAYIVSAVFLMAAGNTFLALVSYLRSKPLEAGIMTFFFSTVFFWILVILVVTILTMRVFSEEKKTGMIEVLLTAPVGDLEYVLSKFAGAFLFYLLIWIPTAAYVFILRHFAEDITQLDMGPIYSGYIGVASVGFLFTAIGCFCSSLTKNQIIAAISSFAMMLGLFLIGLLLHTGNFEQWQDILGYISLPDHMLQFSRGIVDTRHLFFSLSLGVLLLFLTVKAVESRKWKGL